MPPLRAGRRARSLGAYLAVVLTLVGACDRIQRDSPAGDTGELPDQEVSDFSVTETDEGRLEWKMYARNAAIYNARDAIVAHGVRVDFYDEAGKQTSTLTAREGEMNQVRHDMIARGNVVLQTTEGTRMSTEELRFLNQTQRIVERPWPTIRWKMENPGLRVRSSAELRTSAMMVAISPARSSLIPRGLSRFS